MPSQPSGQCSPFAPAPRKPAFRPTGRPCRTRPAARPNDCASAVPTELRKSVGTGARLRESGTVPVTVRRVLSPRPPLLIPPDPSPHRRPLPSATAIASTAVWHGASPLACFSRLSRSGGHGVANTDPKESRPDFRDVSGRLHRHGAASRPDTYRTGSGAAQPEPRRSCSRLPGAVSGWPSAACPSVLGVTSPFDGSLLVTASVLRGTVSCGPGRAATTVRPALPCGPAAGCTVAGLRGQKSTACCWLVWCLAWLAPRPWGRRLLSAVRLGVCGGAQPAPAPLLLIPIGQRRWPALWGPGSPAARVKRGRGLRSGPVPRRLDWLHLGQPNPGPRRLNPNARLPGLVARLGLAPACWCWLVTARRFFVWARPVVGPPARPAPAG